MKKTANILLLLLLALYPSYSQSSNDLFHSEFEQSSFSAFDLHKILFATHASVDHNKYTVYQGELTEVLEKLQKKRHKWSDARVTEKLFYTLHRKMLKWYEQYASFGEVFASGKYDCVSGTGLFAVVLDRLDIPYTIYEFDYHAFLIAETAQGKILLEATDPFHGVITNPDEIARRITIYGNGGDPTDKLRPVGSQTDIRSTHINNHIGLKELAGIQYFNLAVKEFNNSNKAAASVLIEKAYMLYPSDRIRDVRKIFDNQRMVTTR